MVLTEIGTTSEMKLSYSKVEVKAEDVSTSPPSKEDVNVTSSQSILSVKQETETGAGDAASPSVIADKGQPCRDYSHSRHLCLKFPFETTPHQKYCELCYCFVCDCVAPCKYWSVPYGLHCHAFDNEGWKEVRRLMAPVRSIFCLKERANMKWVDQVEDCFVLEFNPFDSVDISKTSELSCRDYPHSRHLCLKFPFETTAHEKYCELCCDSAAPCKYWSAPNGTHCDALDTGSWTEERDLKRQKACNEKI